MSNEAAANLPIHSTDKILSFDELLLQHSLLREDHQACFLRVCQLEEALDLLDAKFYRQQKKLIWLHSQRLLLSHVIHMQSRQIHVIAKAFARLINL